MTSAKKTDPELWESIKEDFLEGDKGGDAGQWSARKAQLAVREYKRRGGGYDDAGPDRSDTDLNDWTEESWGTKSGKKSGKTGERYLPARVRMLLTEDEYRRSTEKKREDSLEGDEQFSDQPESVRDKIAKIRNGGPTKAILMERARDLDVEGRSTMSKYELLEAIDDATDENGRDKRSDIALRKLSKSELYDRARDADIAGRSGMDKSELVAALADC